MSKNKSPWGSGSGGSGNGGSGGGKTPWGQGNQGGQGPRPVGGATNSEKVIQDFKDRFGAGGGRGGRRGPGGGGDSPMNKVGPLGLLATVALIALLASCIYTVDQKEEAMVLRFGEYKRTVAPGLNFKLPYPIETTVIRETRVVNKIDIGGSDKTSLMLTGDENIVDINFTVLWRISDLNNFIFNVDETEIAVKAIAESAMREIVGKNALEKIITTDRLSITISVRDLMQEVLEEYEAGVEVVEVQLQKADPPEGDVIAAFRDVVNAAQDAETTVNRATAYQNDVVPKARGEAAQIIQDAEAYRGRVVAEAAGEAKRFELILEEYKLAPRVTRQRMYLETMEQVYGPAEKIIMDNSSGQGVVPYLPLDQLKSRPGGK